MGAGELPDSVYKSSEASPLGDVLAHINQALPGWGWTFQPEGENCHKVIVFPPETQPDSRPKCLHKCLLTANHEDGGNRPLKIRERFIWTHFTA